MDAKHGNDRERQRQKLEDKIIRRIDKEPSDPSYYHEHGPLRITVLEYICWRAATTGLPAMRSM